MPTKINASKSEKITSEIFKILFPDKEVRFETILGTLSEKKVCYSRATLAKYLNQLHREKKIEYRTNPAKKRETLYRINPLKFDQTSLYPPVMGALLSKLVTEAWHEQFSTVYEKLKKITDTIKIEDVNKTRAELEAEYREIAENSITRIENVIGNIILRSLVYQKEKEKDFQILETMTYFIRFLYLSLLEQEKAIESVYQKDGSHDLIKKCFSVPYNDIERLLVEMMAADIEYNKLMQKVYGTESPLAKLDDNFYKELEEKSEVPFYAVYNMKSGCNIVAEKKNKKAKNGHA